jgi:hypothetical protein
MCTVCAVQTLPNSVISFARFWPSFRELFGIRPPFRRVNIFQLWNEDGPSRNPVSGNVAVSFDHDSIKPQLSYTAAERANLWITKGGGWLGGDSMCVKKREMTI